jgi:hypothetical protein
MEPIPCLLVNYFGMYVVFTLANGRKVFSSKEYRKVCEWVKSHSNAYVIVNDSVCQNKTKED